MHNMTETQILEKLQGKWQSDNELLIMDIDGHEIECITNNESIHTTYSLKWNITYKKWQMVVPTIMWFTSFISEITDTFFKVDNFDTPSHTDVYIDTDTHEMLVSDTVYIFNKLVD